MHLLFTLPQYICYSSLDKTKPGYYLNETPPEEAKYDNKSKETTKVKVHRHLDGRR